MRSPNSIERRRETPCFSYLAHPPHIPSPYTPKNTQEGTSESDWITAIAAVPRGGSATLAGTSEGSIFAEVSSNGAQDFVAISLDVRTKIVATPSPGVSTGGSYESAYGIPSDDGSGSSSSGVSGSDAASSSVTAGGEPVSNDYGDDDHEVLETTPAPTISTTESGVISGSSNIGGETTSAPTVATTESGMISGSGSASRIIDSSAALATTTPSPLSVTTSASSSGEQHEGGQAETDSMFSPIGYDDGGDIGGDDDDDDDGVRQTTSDDGSGQISDVGSHEEISDSASLTLIPTAVATLSPFALAPPNVDDVDASAAPVGGESGDVNELAPPASETSGVSVDMPGGWIGGGTPGGSAVLVMAVCFGSRVLASLLLRR